jgi:membrane protease YdiL (CAAX protease family)
MDVRRIPRTLEEAYELRDSSRTPEERNLYQQHVYRLREEKYRSGNIDTRRSIRRRERAATRGASRSWRARVKRTTRRTGMAVRGLSQRHPLLAFYLLTLATAWSFWIPVAASSRPLLPAHMPPLLLVVGAFGPSLSAIVLMAVEQGRAGIRRLLGPLLKWYVGARWYLVAFLLPAAVYVSAAALYVLLGGVIPPYAGAIPWHLLPVYFVIALLFVGPLQEEVGWRGYALPILQSRMSALSASVVLGSLWAFWHLPLFWTTGPGHPNVSFGLFATAVMALSILFTWVYNNTRGSLLIILLFHASFNFTLWFVPVLPTGMLPLRLSLIGVGLLWVVAIVVVIAEGPARLARKRTS